MSITGPLSPRSHDCGIPESVWFMEISMLNCEQRVGGDLALRPSGHLSHLCDHGPWLLLHIIIWIITMMMITNRRYYPKISGYLTQVIFGDRISPRYQPPTMTHLILQQPAAGPHRPWLLTTGPH